MLSSKSFLCLDFGAGTLKMAEFESGETGALVLRQYGTKPLGLLGSQDAAREGVLKKALQELLADRPVYSRSINVSAPGFQVFSKFVKLPPVDTSKVTQIIQYEAQQNVPFPLEEVVWDYQILGSTPSGELEVLLVAIKSEVVESIFRVAEANALRLQLVDVSPASLYNSFRFNYGDVQGCTMLLDIGAKTSNLLFVEKGKVFSRSINIGANSITQDFAAEAKLRFPEAEQIKIAEGFVSLGGAYEEPENAHQAAISKIARQVMTRLHIQVNQTIQFYRGQQGGAAPQQLFLAGGGSIMPYSAQFFAEKLNIPVEYFNPFRNVQIDPSINLEELASVAHSFGEIVGLALRNIAQCPVELNLVPKSIRKRQQFDQKKPYFIATIFSLVLVVFATGYFYDQVAAVQSDALAKIQAEAQPLKDEEAKLKTQERDIDRSQKEIKEFSDWAKQRLFWPEILTQLRGALLRAEQAAGRPGTEAGVWIEALGTQSATSASATPSADSNEEGNNPTPFYMMDPLLAQRYGLKVDQHALELYKQRMQQQEGGGTTEGPAATDLTGATPGLGAGISKKNTNTMETINVKFKAIDLQRNGAAGANRNFMFQVVQQLQAIPLLDPVGTTNSFIEDVDSSGVTFHFGVTLKLKEPISKL